jgi:hypothetical protein
LRTVRGGGVRWPFRDLVGIMRIENGRPSSCTQLFGLTPKGLHQRGEAAIVWRRAGESLGVFECGPEIPSIAAEADERQQRVAIAGMPGQALLENRHGIVNLPGRMRPTA